MNCLEKLNPAERLILESVCTDCSTDAVLTYKWSLLSFTSLAKETEIAGFSSMTTTGIDKANIAVKGNILEAGKDYSLKISAWKPGGEKGLFFITPFLSSFHIIAIYCYVSTYHLSNISGHFDIYWKPLHFVCEVMQNIYIYIYM